ncbi:hypothetical protein RAA17_12285 [Komagataeibacter rhaeticus]|nr:hypothetical protein [Komagataeibacter rhaeticus]
MVSSLGGARRLAGGMADDMERAARAARDIASSSGRFRGGASPRGSYGNDGGSTRARLPHPCRLSRLPTLGAAATFPHIQPPPPMCQVRRSFFCRRRKSAHRNGSYGAARSE